MFYPSISILIILIALFVSVSSVNRKKKEVGKVGKGDVKKALRELERAGK